MAFTTSEIFYTGVKKKKSSWPLKIYDKGIHKMKQQIFSIINCKGWK